MRRLASLLALGRSWRDLKLAWLLMRDARVPLLTKVVPVLAIAYVIWPVDLISDAIPLLGQLDDAGVLLLGLRSFLHLARRGLRDER